jgi:hypothetical protein
MPGFDLRDGARPPTRGFKWEGTTAGWHQAVMTAYYSQRRRQPPRWNRCVGLLPWKMMVSLDMNEFSVAVRGESDAAVRRGVERCAPWVCDSAAKRTVRVTIVIVCATNVVDGTGGGVYIQCTGCGVLPLSAGTERWL